MAASINRNYQLVVHPYGRISKSLKAHIDDCGGLVCTSMDDAVGIAGKIAAHEEVDWIGISPIRTVLRVSGEATRKRLRGKDGKAKAQGEKADAEA